MTTQYVMRAFNTATNSHVYWAVLNTPDYTGAESGYNPADLTNIVIDYSFEVPINGSGGAIPPGLAGGDLTGTYPDPNVAKIAGTKVAVITPTDGQVLTYVASNSDWEPKPSIAGGGNAGGDLSGTYPNPTVSKIHSATVPVAGSLTPGNVLQVSGPSALSYGPVNLAGGVTAVSGQLPTGNQVPQTVGGDLSGTTANAIVAKLDGYVLSAPNPQSGQFLEFNGTDWVPATLTNLPPSGSAGGDLSGTYPNPNVIKLQGKAVASTTPQNGYVLTWNTTNNDWEPARTFAFEVQPNPSWTQATWFIDPQSSFGGDDTNDGLTASTPVKTWKQVILRFGTYSPLLIQNTTFTFLSNHIDNSDPVIFTPYLGGNAPINIVITGILNSSNQVSTGAFSGSIMKNRDTGTLFTTTLTNTPVPGWFVHDTSNDGYSWVYKNPGANVAVLSQPMASSITAFNLNNFIPAEIDNAIDGNIYIAYEPIHVNIAQISVQSLIESGFNNTGRIIIQSLVIFDPNGAGTDDVIIGDWVVLLETRIDRWALINQFSDEIILPILNCVINGGATIDSYVSILGGILGLAYSAVLVGVLEKQLDGDIIISNNNSNSLYIYSGIVSLGYYYIEQNTTVYAYQTSKLVSNGLYTGGGNSSAWGYGNISVDSVYIYRSASGNVAQGHFKTTGSLVLNGKSTAYSFDPSGNGIWREGINLTPAKLDASLSSGGFGGTALIPGAGIITAYGDGYGYNYSTSDSLSVANWYIDPQFGSNANDGKTALTPIQTWAELIRRWGTTSPLFNIPVVITFLSDQLTSFDPVSLTPGFTGSGSLTIAGTLQHEIDGYLSSVIPKNKLATGPNPAGLLQANLTASADGYAGYLLVNPTRGNAICWIDSISSGNAVLTQPFISNVPGYNIYPNQVDTFANGDTFSIYQPTKIYVSGFVQGIGAGTIIFAHLWLIDPTLAVGNTEVSLPTSSTCIETRLDTYILFNLNTTVASVNSLVNSWCNGGIAVFGGSMVGGASGTALVNSTNINGFVDGDAIIHGVTFFGDSQSEGFLDNQIGSVYLDNSSLLVTDNITYIAGDLLLSNDGYGTNYQFGIYGQYTLNLSTVSCKLIYINGTATQWFGGTPTLLIDSVSYANAYDRSIDPGVWHPARSLTPAYLDLPIMQGGFGGLAIGDSGAVITNGVQTSTPPVPYTTQATWFIDPQSTFGGNDGYDGLTQTTAIKTWAEVIRRYGTFSPVLNQNTIFTFLSSHTDDSDPVVFTPYLNSAQVTIQGALNDIVSSGTFSGTVTQNYTTGQLWETNFSNTPQVGSFLHFPPNAISYGYDGYAWVWKNPYGDTAILSQPLVSYQNIFDILPFDGLLSIGDGYAYEAYQLINVNLVKIGVQSVNTFGGNYSMLVTHINGFDPNGLGIDDIAVGEYVTFAECKLDKFYYDNNANGNASLTNLMNCYFNGGFEISDSGIGTNFIGGILGNGIKDQTGDSAANITIEGSIFDCNILLQANRTYLGICHIPLNQVITLKLNAGVNNSMEEAILGDNFIWGPGALDIQGNYLYSGTAVHNFQQTGGLKLNGKMVASAFDSNNNSTWIDNIPLTPANLDLPVIQGGFGGTALIAGGGVITRADDGYGFNYGSTDVDSCSYFVDPSNVTALASDKNDGLTSSTPILTTADLNRRIANRKLIADTTITYMSDDIGSVGLNYSTLDINNFNLTFQGTPVVMYTGGTINAGTVAINPSSNQRQVLHTSDLSDFDGYVYSALAGTSTDPCYVVDETTGDSAWIVSTRNWYSYNSALPSMSKPVNMTDPFTIVSGTLGIGHNYKIQRGSKLSINVIHSPTIANNEFIFQDFALQLLTVNPSSGATINRCSFLNSIISGDITLNNCFMGSGIQNQYGSIIVHSGVLVTTGNDFCNSETQFDGDLYITNISAGYPFNGDSLIISPVDYSNLWIPPGIGSGIQIHDGYGDGVNISGMSFLGAPYSNEALIWGMGNGDVGILIGPGGTALVSGSKIPKITGTEGDFGFLSTTNNNIVLVGRAWDDGYGAYTEAGGPATRITSWTNFSQTIDSGGFELQAHDVATNAHIIGK